MLISLDYDHTYTLDPDVWDRFIHMMQFSGHDVVVVTYRHPSMPVGHEFNIPVYYTSYKAKRLYMNRLGVAIDVWVDDQPETILMDSEWTDEERERWKAEHIK